jgi:hypothetical protein
MEEVKEEVEKEVEAVVAVVAVVFLSSNIFIHHSTKVFIL